MSASPLDRSISEECRQTLVRERQQASFNEQAMVDYLNGGPLHTHYKNLALQIIERDPELLIPGEFDRDRPLAREISMKQLRRLYEIRNSPSVAHDNPLLDRYLCAFLNSYDRSVGMRLYVHDTLFRESIWAQGTAQQWEKYKDAIQRMEIIGCYSMTELGHSSHLQGIETTATFDKERQEFIIHTPSITATKWWIGMAGHAATHTVALCKLIIDGKEHGLQWFLVPLRSPLDGRLLPGVLCGDVGAKMGRNGLDNGFLQFTNVRIPRENMLMKWAQVSPQGEFTPPPNPTLPYASLIGERLIVMQALFDCVGQGATIAVRYGALRRQGNNNEQIIDFQSYHSWLMPVLAGVFVAHAAFRTLMGSWESSLQLAQSSKPEHRKEFLTRSHDMHATTAALKAWYGWWGADALETCRRCLGGHGYSAYNAIAGLLADWAVITTGGGDNIVLAQQSARYLIGCVRRAMEGKELSSNVAYLSQPVSAQQFPAQSEADVCNIGLLLEAYRWLSYTLITESATQLQSEISRCGTVEQAWNSNMMQLVEGSRAHSFYFLVKNFSDSINSASSLPPTPAQSTSSIWSQPLSAHQIPALTDSGCKSVLRQLCVLFALSSLQPMLHHFLERGYMNRQHAQWIRAQTLRLCVEIRKEAVALVDCFGWPDWILKAPVARYDGDIYPAYLNTVKAAPNATAVPHYFAQSVAPLVQKHAKL